MFNKKSKRRGKKPAIPENLASYIRMAPAEATTMRCQLIYSASPGMSGLLFQGWRDEDGDVIEATGEKPPYASTIPTPVAEYYIDNTHNMGKMDLDMMREHLGIRVEYVQDEEITPGDGYRPRHLSTAPEENDTPGPTVITPYRAKHRPGKAHGSPRSMVESPHLTPEAMEKAKKRREMAGASPSGEGEMGIAPEREDELLPRVAPRSNPRSR